jgi:hypothetical protein
MKWFDRWFKKKCLEAWNSEDSTPELKENKVRRGIAIRETSGEQLSAKGLRFTLYKSVGGHILETHVYDNRLDENRNTLYMINEEDDFAKQVAQAIMLESMKQ